MLFVLAAAALSGLLTLLFMAVIADMRDAESVGAGGEPLTSEQFERLYATPTERGSAAQVSSEGAASGAVELRK